MLLKQLKRMKSNYKSLPATALPFLKKNAVLLFAAALGFGWLLFIYNAGVQLSPDSGYYLSYGLNMHYDGDYFVHAVRPPVYPFMVNLFMYLDGFPADAAALVSGFTMILLLIVFARILTRFSDDTLLNCLFLAALFTFEKIIYIFIHAWSEIPFALFVISAFYFLLRHHETGRTKYYVFAAILVSLTTMTRFMGYALVGAFFLYTLYFLYRRRVERKEKDVSILKYLLLNSITYLPVLAFIIRNYVVSKTFHGSRVPTHLTSFGNYRKVIGVLEANLSTYFIVLLVLSLVVYLLFMKKQLPVETCRTTYSLPLTYILVFVFIYTAMLIYTTSTVRVDPVSERYFSPIYALFFLFVFMVSQVLLQAKGVGKGVKTGVRIFLYSALLMMLLVQTRELSHFMDASIASNISREDCYPLRAGYVKSPPMAQIKKYLKEILRKDDTVYFSGIHETGTHFNYPHLARTIFFRRAIFHQPGMTDVSIDTAKKSDFTISLSLEGKKKTIHFRNMQRLKVNRALFNGLVLRMEGENIQSLCLVTSSNVGVKKRLIANLKPLLPPRLSVQSKKRVGGYIIYHLVYAIP